MSLITLPRLTGALLLVLLTGIASPSLAQTSAYVTDDVEVTLRTGTSTRHGIVRMLSTGIEVTVLESDKESGYSRVRTGNGAEGWVLTRYLVDQPPPKTRIGTVETRLAEAREETQRLREELGQLRGQQGELSQDREQLAEQNASLKRELEEIRRVASEHLAIAEDNQRLNREMAEIQTENMKLRQDYETTKDRSRRDWFVVGAIVVIGSMLFGILLTRIRWRKRSSWGDL